MLKLKDKFVVGMMFLVVVCVVYVLGLMVVCMDKKIDLIQLEIEQINHQLL